MSEVNKYSYDPCYIVMIIHNHTKIIKTTENVTNCLIVSIPSDQCIKHSQITYNTYDICVNPIPTLIPLTDNERMRFLDTVWQFGKSKDYEFILIDISTLSQVAKEEWEHKITMKNARTQGWFQTVYIKY